MKLSSQKDLLLIIILSIAVLIMSWLKLINGYSLSLLPTILVLFLPGYALITAIWPSDEKMGWTLRLGMGFVLGLVFILFLPLIFNSLKWTALTGSLNQILLIVAIVFSLIAMARRKEPVDEMELLRRDPQLTLEESIERATLMRQKAEAEPNEYEDHYEGDGEYYEDEYYEGETPESEEHPEEYYSEYDEGLEDEAHGEPEGEQWDEPSEEIEEESEEELWDESSEEIEQNRGEELEEQPPDMEPRKYQDLKKEKPLQYERIKDKYPLDEDEYHSEDDESHRNEDQYHSDNGYIPDYHESPQDEEDHSEQPRGIPLRVEEPVKTSPTDYEAEMNKPVWAEEPPQKKPGFKNWDLVMILFLSGISLLFLYFNPLKTTTTSIIFFILLLFILGYAGLTIIFPDKSRASSRNLLLASTIIAVILFILSFLAWNIHLLPSVPKYIVTIMFVASIILVVGAFIRKWYTQGRKEEVSSEDQEEIYPVPDETYEDQEEEVEKTESTGKEADKTEELIPSRAAKEETLRKLQAISTPVKTDKETKRESVVKKTHSDDHKSPQQFFGGSKWEKALSIILIISLILAISATIYIIVTPKQGEKFTEFYILGSNGTASNYPTNLTTGQNGSMIIGVVNHEYTTTDYLLVVKVNDTILKNQTLTLTNGQKVEIPYTFTAGSTGQKKLEFLLYKLPDNETAYRSLHLWMNVT